MDYITIIRRIRNILGIAFLINVALVATCWGFVWMDLMRYFMWALPGFTIESASDFIMRAATMLHMISIAIFLIPTIALSIEIPGARRREIREQRDFEKWKEWVAEHEQEIYAADGIALNEPARKASKPAKMRKQKSKNIPF